MPAAARALLRAADEERIEPQPAPHQQRARALRAAELVRGDRAEVGVERAKVDRHVTGGRARVDVHEHAARPRAAAHDLGRRLQRADLVVGELHRHERGVGAHRVEHLGRVEAPEAVDADDRHLGVGPRDRVAHARVLDRGGDDVAGARATACERTPDRGVHRLGARRREHDLARPGAEERRDLLARVFERDARHPPFGVQAAGIGVVLAQEREHRLERGGAQR